jgi:hypothetical protein
MGLYHPLDGVTNLKYKLLYFLTPNKKNSKRKALVFHWDRCCHLAICLQLIDSLPLVNVRPWISIEIKGEIESLGRCETGLEWTIRLDTSIIQGWFK